MKTDVNGCSTCPAGDEKYVYFTVRVSRTDRNMVQYDYRTAEGELFSCVAQGLEDARRQRDAWLQGRKNGGGGMRRGAKVAVSREWLRSVALAVELEARTVEDSGGNGLQTVAAADLRGIAKVLRETAERD